MPPTEAKYRITGTIRGQQAWFFRQESDGMIQFVDIEDLRLAAQFPKSQAIERCRQLREMGYDFRVALPDGTIVFEEESQPRPVTIDFGEDMRPSLFYIGAGHEADGLGYILRPALKPDIGKCYCVRAIDIPALAGREIESVFDRDPERAVQKFLLICKQGGIDLATLPSRRPDLDKIEDTELRKIIQNIQNQNARTPANIRPGDR
jgi:hypothetical protein